MHSSPASLNDNILHDYSPPSKPGNQRWYSPTSLFRFHQLHSMWMCVCTHTFMSLCNFIACVAWCNLKKHTFAAVRIPGTLRFLEEIPGEPQGGNETVTGVLSQSIALFVPDNKWEENIESRDRMGRREALVVVWHVMGSLLVVPTPESQLKAHRACL